MLLGGGVVCLALGADSQALAESIVARAIANPPPAPAPSSSPVTGEGTCSAHPDVLCEFEWALAIGSVRSGWLDWVSWFALPTDRERWQPLLRQHRLASIAIESRRGPDELQLRALW